MEAEIYSSHNVYVLEM